jgi:hypothetical protein
MEELIAYRQVLLAALENIIDELTHIVKVTPISVWHQPYGLDTHTPHITLAHLRELEAEWFAVQLPRLQHETTPVLPICSKQDWIGNHYHPDEAIEDIVDEFSNLRKHELTWLRSLSPEDWSRMARHPRYGLHTLQWWVEHQLDLSHQHLQKLAAVSNK